VGNRTYAAGSAGGPLVSASYTYDSIYRLTQESLASAGVQAENGALTYGLDAVGNRQTLTSTLSAIATQPPMSYNANDRLLTNSYDANGNTLGAGGKTFAYDSQDRLTSFNGGAVTMVYDGDGNRVSKTAGGVTTVYLVDEANPTGLAQVVEEIAGGAVKTRYLYGLERIGQTQVASGTTSFYGYDGHGDVRYLTDVAGKVTDTYDYDAFGNVVGSTGATANVYRYQGEAFDSETGLYYLRARYYDPVAGRFLSADPLADQGEHPYTYAGADPVNGHDPTGTQDFIEYSMATAVVVPSAAVMAGMAADLKCIASLALSRLLGPAAVMVGVKGCLAMFRDTREPSTPGPGSPSGPGKTLTPCSFSAQTLQNYMSTAPAYTAQGKLIPQGAASRPLASCASTIMEDGVQDNVDPRLLVAMAFVEGKWGGDTDAASTDNSFGLHNAQGHLGNFTKIGGWAVGIQEAAETVNTMIYDRNLNTVSLLYSGLPGAYCQGPNCKAHKGGVVSKQLKALGGDPASLSSPCYLQDGNYYEKSK